jgi:hypothetical protein
MCFQRARAHAGDDGEGLESDRLIRPGIEPIERLRKTDGQSISHIRQTAGAAFPLLGTHDHALALGSRLLGSALNHSEPDRFGLRILHHLAETA